MIALEQPSMALNAHDVGCEYQMWNTWKVDEADSEEKVISHVAQVARTAPGGRLKNVVFNTHGRPGSVKIGGGRINRSHTIMFAQWAGLVEKIWFNACNLAETQTPGQYPWGDGNLFCCEVAKNAKCYVVAPHDLQTTRSEHVYPYGQIDSFEGLLLCYGPEGNVTWSHKYRDSWWWNRE